METTNHLIATARDLLHQDCLEPALKPTALLSMDIITPATIYVKAVIPAKAGIQNWTGCRIKSGMTMDMFNCRSNYKGTSCKSATTNEEGGLYAKTDKSFPGSDRWGSNRQVAAAEGR